MINNTLYNSLNIYRTFSLAQFNLLTRLKGYDCILTYPVEEDLDTNSIFGADDALISYKESLQVSKKLLIFNLFKEQFIGGTSEFDSFIEGCYCLTLYEEKLPLTTKVEVDLRGRKIMLKVDDGLSTTPMVQSQLFIKQPLVPFL